MGYLYLWERRLEVCHQLQQAECLDFAHFASNAPPSNETRPAATLLTLPGVMSVAEMNALSDTLGVSAARTLGVSDTETLRGVLEAPADGAQLMRALRRLAMAPLTVGLSASTGIDEAVTAVHADESASADAH